MREHRAEGRFTDAAFARENEYFVLYRGEACGDDGDVGVGALGCGGAYCLVGAAGAIVSGTSLLRLGTWAVFYDGVLACVFASCG